MATTAELNVLDQLYLHLDRAHEPWTVQLEVGVEGRLDATRVAAAIAAACRRHPIARARLAPWRGTDVRYRWDIADAVGDDDVPLHVRSCEGDEALRAAREELLDAGPGLDSAPPFAMTLAHHPHGDALMLNLSHAAGDGISAVRLMASILRAYAGEPDPLPPVDPLDVRDIGPLVDSRSLMSRLVRSRALAAQGSRMLAPPARIAADSAAARDGYGFALLRLDAGELEHLRSLRTPGATVNDVLLGALAVTVHEWNEAHGEGSQRLSIIMPVNLRPAEWRTEVVGNFASYVSVAFDASEQDDLERAVAAAAERTRRIKQDGVAGLVVDLLELPTATLPVAVKRRFQDLIELTGSRFVDTTMLSNLGRLDALPRLDAEAGSVDRVWFSPPGRMPLGASLGAVSYGGELFLTLRHRHALLDSAAAAAFAGRLRDVLTAPRPQGAR
jgi:NRPS condensation-like uncharacterized protein